jgi:hypothetical protein
MVAPCLSAVALHSLLHDGPVAVVGHDKAVQIEVEPILHRRAVDLGDEPARRRQCRAIKADPMSWSSSGVRRERALRPPHTWMPSAPESGPRPRFSTPTTLVAMPEECQSIAHDGAERLEPEWVRQAAQQLLAPVVVDDRLADHSTRPRHAVGQPFRDVTAMQRQIGAAGFASHQRTPGDRDNCNFVVHYIGTRRLAGNRRRS